ncbi:MAG: glycosyltransferase [Terriglobia bacterium]
MGPDLPLRILFVLPYPPNRIRTRSFHLLRALVAEGHKITLATLSKCETELHEVDDLADRLDSLIVEQLGSWRSLWNSLRAMPTSQPIQSAYSWSPRFANKLLQVVKEKQFDIIHVEHLRGARYGSMLASFVSRHSDREIPVVWDSVDCISGLFHQAAQQSHTFRSRFITAFELPRTQFYEAGLVRQFDRVLVTSETDREELLTLAEKKCRKAAKPTQSILAKKVVVVPNGVDLQYFVPK